MDSFTAMVLYYIAIGNWVLACAMLNSSLEPDNIAWAIRLGCTSIQNTGQGDANGGKGSNGFASNGGGSTLPDLWPTPTMSQRVQNLWAVGRNVAVTIVGADNIVNGSLLLTPPPPGSPDYGMGARQ